jgi:hypothetical protein
LQALERAKEAMENGKCEESELLISQSNLLFQQGSASNTEYTLAAQMLTRLQSERDAFHAKARGLEALTAGVDRTSS